MRRGVWAIAVSAVLVSGVGLVGAVPTGAAVASNTVTVAKGVVGTAPAGTTFTVSISCQNLANPGTPETATMHFDATGQATDTHVFPIAAGIDCTITETVNGGATTVAYSCAFTHGATDPNGTLGSCGSATGNTVHFGDVIGDSATITVVNTFVAPVTTTVTTAAPATAAAPAVAAKPAFTG
jgi:hypothetical protein